MVAPHIITLPKISSKSGHLYFIEQTANFPFEIKRAYWIYDLEPEASRGDLAHRNADRILVCMKGEVEVFLESTGGKSLTFTLRHPWEALFFPRMHWIKLKFSGDAILMVLASCLHEEDDTIRDYQAFKAYNQSRVAQ